MKPAPFDYQRPDSLDRAIALLADAGGEAQVLAGGQTLMAMLNMRLSRPATVIDINRLPALDEIALDDDGGVRIGALARLATLERSEAVARHLPLLALALPHIAHPAIRNRGTLGGSLALADPAAELPAVAVALEAEIELAGPAGARIVAAGEFFRGLYETARRPDEILTAIRFPKAPSDRQFVFDEFARRHGDFAIVGLAGRFALDNGRLRDLRLVFFGCEDRPKPAIALAAALDGLALADLDAAVAPALANDLDPLASLEGGPAFKRHLAQVLTRRALAAAIAAASG